MPAATSALRDVELVSVGTWAASTGVTTITRADLEAMLAASRDNVVDSAPVKLGHLSELNRGLGDGEPAFGWVVLKGIRKGANGADTLVGDLVGMPTALAEAAPTAYRRRSVEIAWGVTTPAGKRYPAVLTALSLLGAKPPAVKGLADVLALLTAAAHAPTADSSAELELVDGLEDNNVAVAMLAAARHAGATVDVLDALASAAGARDTADVPPASADDRHDAPEPQTPTQEARPMATYTDAQLRELLSLEADADVDAALRQLASGEQPPAQPGEPGFPGAPGGAPTGEPSSPVSTPTGEPEVPEVPADPASIPAQDAAPQLVTLSAGSHAELTELAAWARTERRTRVLDAAVREGRIAPAERSAFAAQLERDEQGTTTLLSGLAPRFPVSELGSADAATTTADEAAAKAFDEFEARTFGLDRSASA